MKYTKDFFSDVKQLADTIEEIGNPFLEDSKELVSLDSNLVSCKKALKISSNTKVKNNLKN